MLQLNLTIGAPTGPRLLTVILEMTVLANRERSSYIKSVHLIDALSDHYHRRPYRALRFLTIVLVLRKTYINHDKEMIKEIRRKSIKDGMKQPLFREALKR